MQKGYTHEINEKFASKVMVVNCESNFWTVREVLPGMLKRNRGQIVTIASAAGLAATA